MAEVWLPHRDGRCLPLPAICVRCGRPATCSQSVVLSPHHFSRDTVTAEMPLCRADWWMARTAAFVTLGIVLVVIGTGRQLISLGIVSESTYFTWTKPLGVGAVAFFGHRGATLGLRATAVTADEVAVSGVSDGLADHLKAHPLCRGCGYDLTGNLSGVCPECGKPKRAGWTPEL